MNAKNIISAILMVLSFAACSSNIEGFDDNMTNNNTNNGETSISVRMVMEGGSTKAGTTIDLTTEEAAIKKLCNCSIRGEVWRTCRLCFRNS